MKKKNTTWKVKRKKEKSRLPKIAIIIIMIIIYIILPFRKQRVWESGAMQTCCFAVMFATSLRVWTFELRAALFFHHCDSQSCPNNKCACMYNYTLYGVVWRWEIQVSYLSFRQKGVTARISSLISGYIFCNTGIKCDAHPIQLNIFISAANRLKK